MEALDVNRAKMTNTAATTTTLVAVGVPWVVVGLVILVAGFLFFMIRRK